jgi:23S rRNA (guanosine2251-2'-O)-methyltransferase
MRSLVLIAHNLRSTHNVGSLLRTAEGLGVEQVFLTGYTPYPLQDGDDRLPHLAHKIDKQISKTALGAETMMAWHHTTDLEALISSLKKRDFTLTALEQSQQAISLPDFKPPQRVAVIVGREVEGIEPGVLGQCDHILEIPMLGRKESFNVVQAAAMALYELQFHR